MPTNKKNNRGGKLSRARRKHKRAQAVRVSSGVYGPTTHVTIEYYGRFDITDKDWSTKWTMKHVPFGNKQVFSGSYAKYTIFREYRLKQAHFLLTHELIKSSSWKKEKHCEIATYSVAAFLQDYDVQIVADEKGEETWDSVCSHPGSKNHVISTGTSKRTSLFWRPTEASDTDWRLTNDDGLCHLYIVAKKLDHNDEGILDTYGHQVSTVVDVRISLELRGIDIQTKDSLVKPPTGQLSPRQASSSKQLLVDRNVPEVVDRPPSPTYSGDCEFIPVSPAVSVSGDLDRSLSDMHI